MYVYYVKRFGPIVAAVLVFAAVLLWDRHVINPFVRIGGMIAVITAGLTAFACCWLFLWQPTILPPIRRTIEAPTGEGEMRIIVSFRGCPAGRPTGALRAEMMRRRASVDSYVGTCMAKSMDEPGDRPQLLADNAELQDKLRRAIERGDRYQQVAKTAEEALPQQLEALRKTAEQAIQLIQERSPRPAAVILDSRLRRRETKPEPAKKKRDRVLPGADSPGKCDLCSHDTTRENRRRVLVRDVCRDVSKPGVREDVWVCAGDDREEGSCEYIAINRMGGKRAAATVGESTVVGQEPAEIPS